MIGILILEASQNGNFEESFRLLRVLKEVNIEEERCCLTLQRQYYDLQFSIRVIEDTWSSRISVVVCYFC